MKPRDSYFQATPNAERFPLPNFLYPTPEQSMMQRDVLHLARLIRLYRPAQQVGWILYLLQCLEQLYLIDQFPDIKHILEALHKDISTRLETATW